MIYSGFLSDYTSIKEESDSELENITVQGCVLEELAKLKSEGTQKETTSGARSATMSRKAKAKGRATASKLKSKGKLRAKKATSARKPAAKARKKAKIVRPEAKSGGGSKKIVRIMGHGQFTVDSKTLKKLNDIDKAMVKLVSIERSDDTEFKKKLTELSEIVIRNGRPLDPHEITKSDIILPSVDLSLDEAKRLFIGEGVIPEI
jgi:hypothetical protein